MDAYFSVIIPYFKIPKGLFINCLRSLEFQTYRRFETIIVNDGDENFPVEEINGFWDKLNIKLIYQENRGVSVARNRGIEVAEGDYLLFLDADDKLMNDCLEKCNRAVEDSVVDIYIGKYLTNKCNRAVSRDYSNIQCDKEELISCIISHENNFPNYAIGGPWGKIFRREYLQKSNIRFIEGIKKCQDRLFMLECVENANKFIFLDEYLYVYTVDNPNRVCVRYNDEIDSILKEVLRYTNNFVKGHYPQNNQIKYAFGQMNINFIIVILKLKYLHKNRGINFLCRLKEIKQFSKEFNVKYYIENYSISGLTYKWKFVFLFLRLLD